MMSEQEDRKEGRLASWCSSLGSEYTLESICPHFCPKVVRTEGSRAHRRESSLPDDIPRGLHLLLHVFGSMSNKWDELPYPVHKMETHCLHCQ